MISQKSLHQKKMYLILLLLAVVSGQKYLITKAVYNGTVSYSAFQKTCLKEYPGSQPCTSDNLLEGFWTFAAKLRPTVWLFDAQTNCLGYSSDSLEVDGTCLISGLYYVSTCSCNMYLPLLCHNQ